MGGEKLREMVGGVHVGREEGAVRIRFPKPITQAARGEREAGQPRGVVRKQSTTSMEDNEVKKQIRVGEVIDEDTKVYSYQLHNRRYLNAKLPILHKDFLESPELKEMQLLLPLRVCFVCLWALLLRARWWPWGLCGVAGCGFHCYILTKKGRIWPALREASTPQTLRALYAAVSLRFG